MILAAALAALSLFGADTRSDAQIESDLRTRLARSKIKEDGFTFRVKGGVVTWEGRTAIQQRKGAATRMAKAAGARKVVNNIKVGSSAPPRRVEVVKPGQTRNNLDR
jgi:hypothetical protein